MNRWNLKKIYIVVAQLNMKENNFFKMKPSKKSAIIKNKIPKISVNLTKVPREQTITKFNSKV